MNKFILTRDVTTKECHWLDRDFNKGEIVTEYMDCTYGCIGEDGIAVTINGVQGFFEIPLDAIKSI